MAFLVRISDKAFADVEEGYLWLKDRSESSADAWYNGLIDAMYSLEELPARCRLASESEEIGRDIRQLLYGKGNQIRRIIFTITGHTVYILRVWPAVRDRLTADDLSE